MRVTVPRPVYVFVAALAVFGQAGCGGSPEVGPAEPPPPGVAEVQPSWSSCVAVGAPVANEEVAAVLQLPRLGADFVPAAVVVCQYRAERRADGGEDLLAVEGRASEPAEVAAVAAAVRLPNEPRTGAACTLDLPGVAWFALVDSAGRWARPGVPVDSCGRIRVEVRQAVEALTLTRVAAHPVRELESAAAAAAGCTETWADMVWVSGQHQADPPPADRDDPLATAGQLRVCVYRVPASEQGGGKPAGTFERGGILAAERRTGLAAALRGTAAAPVCTAPAGRFALLRAADGAGGAVYVELDGCQRVLVESVNGPAWLGKADAALIALLDQP